MENEKPKLMGIIETVSKHVGASVGTATIVGKRIAGASARGVTTAGGLLRRLVKPPVWRAAEEMAPTSEVSAVEPTAGEATARENDLSGAATARGGNSAKTRHEAKKSRNSAKRARPQPASQVRDLQAEKESLISEPGEAKSGMKRMKSQLSSAPSTVRTKGEMMSSDPDEEKVAVVPVKEEMEPSMEATATQPEEGNMKIKKQGSRALTAEAEVPSPPDVTLEEMSAAAFSNAAEKIMFTSFLSDIASQDATVRADAIKATAEIHHELSVRALVAEMAREPSPQVRLECIKALTKLEMKEGLPAIERALTDEAASVRLAAVWGLYRLAGAESASALTHMFSDEDEEVRRRAATCIAWLGQERLAPELVPLLTDSSVWVRRAAVDAMGNLRSRKVVPALIERLNDPEESVREAVVAALEKITGKKMGGPFPADERSHQRLVARWREWWKEEHPG